MVPVRGVSPLIYRSLSRAEMGVVALLEFQCGQVEQFLGPVPEIVAAAQRGLAHHMVAIEYDGALAGFYVVHPDRRDLSCWWLGWFAIDGRFQGLGFGTSALAGVMRRLLQVPGCRRVRLLVAPENAPALKLYRRAGFAAIAVAEATAELILECVLAAGRPSSEVAARFWANAILLQVIAARVYRMGALPAAELHGEVANPP